LAPVVAVLVVTLALAALEGTALTAPPVTVAAVVVGGGQPLSLAGVTAAAELVFMAKALTARVALSVVAQAVVAAVRRAILVAAVLARTAALTVVVEAAILKAPVVAPMEGVLVEPFVLFGALAGNAALRHSHQPMLALNFWKNR
jgi:hypothetical protein